MKAALFRRQGGPEVLEYTDADDPKPRPGEVVVAVHAAALNRLDVRARADRAEVAPMPHIGGSDVVGEIAEIGLGVGDWKLGDLVAVYPIVSCGCCVYCRSGDPALCNVQKVFGFQTQGGFAEKVAVPTRNLVRLPASVDMLTLAAVPIAYTTAWRMLGTRVAVLPGYWVLIHSASGGVGVAALQIAKYLGAHVIGTAGTDEKAQVVRDMGADVALSYRSGDVARTVLEVTDGEGVHVVVDTVGADTWSTSLDCLRKNGTVVTCGVTSGSVAKMNIRRLYQRQASVVGTVMGGKAELETVMGLVLQCAFRPRVHQVYPLAEIRAAHETLEARQHVGKIVMDVRA